MKKRKEALQGATDFHYENFLRRSRYTSVFLVLLAAFCVITVLKVCAKMEISFLSFCQGVDKH